MSLGVARRGLSCRERWQEHGVPAMGGGMAVMGEHLGGGPSAPNIGPGPPSCNGVTVGVTA